MGVYKKDNGKWYCRGQINGERYHLPCTGAKDKEQARALEDAERFRIRQKQKGLLNEKEKPISFGFMMDNFKKISKANNKTGKEAEIKAKYLCMYFGRQKNVLCIKPSDIEKFKLYLKEQGKSNATVNRYLAAIKRAYNLLIYDDLIVYNPMKKVKMLTEDNLRNRHLTIKEWNKLKLAMPKQLHDIVVIAILTGFRKSNVLNLRWEQIDFELGIIEILKQNNKGKKHIKHPMSEDLVCFLQSLNPKKSGHLFVNPDTGKPYTTVRKSFNSALKRAGISDFKFHDLRRTFSTWLRQRGADLKTIQILLGHSSVSVTERYLGLGSEETKNTVDLLNGFVL